MARPDTDVRKRNEEIVLRVVEAHNEGAEGMLSVFDEFMHPEVEMNPRVIGGVEGSTYRGKEGVRSWYAERAEAFEKASVEVTSCRSVSDSAVLCTINSYGRGKSSGAEVDERIAFIDELEDGLITRITVYGSARQAEEAAKELAS